MAQLNLTNLRGDLVASADRRQAVKQASARKSAAKESMDEAWARIFASKLTDADRGKLAEVKRAMSEGSIGRSPSDTHTKKGTPKRFSKAEAIRLYAVLQERNKADRLRKMVEDTPENYELITTDDALSRFVAELQNEEIIAIDTETTGVDVYSDDIVGISVTLPDSDRHVYIPVEPTKDDHAMNRAAVLDALRPALEDAMIGKVLFNAIFDRNILRSHGVEFRGIAWDAMTAMHLLNENEPSYKLKDLAPKYLGVESDTYDELFGKNAQFAEVPLDVALVYAAKDTQLTWELYRFQERHLRKFPEMYEYYTTVEVPLLDVIADLESNGYILDLDFAKEYGERLRKEAAELHEYLVDKLAKYHEGDEPINVNSPHQMRPALSKAIGKELPNLDANRTLKPLRKQHEIIDRLLEYKRVTKLSGTYIEALPKKQNRTTKRWHSRFNPMGTVTGRFSSGKDEEDKTGSGFNVQNQPEDVRPMFVPPPDKVLIGADFKAQEIRCTAYLSGEPVLIDAFNTGRDPYAMMASQFYKRPYEEVNKLPDGSDTKERKQMKVVWLATLYGMSDFALGDMLGIAKKDATAFKDEVFGSMPKLNAWLESNKTFVQKNGFVWADKKYRKRRLKDAQLKREFIPYGKYNDPKFEPQRLNNSRINRALRQATNARVQGTSSIQTKVTMIEADRMCHEKGNGWHLWGTVHDEILWEAPADFTRADIADIERVMTESYRFGDVPNGTDIEVARRWGHGMTVDEWFKQNEKGAI
ncbi:DNA polymerase [Alteribacter populi]|uniref:DNA polymerase n=1 Tax=Alteribacter populi TaxID=2011011 RepID=UPI000BBA4FE8|nr:DNA polymerase [Alteribacter populi]